MTSNHRVPKLSGMMIPKISELKKETLSQTYENLNRLLKGESGENYDNITELVSSGQGLNAYEQSIRMMIIDSLKSKEGVIQALLSDDLCQIKRALNCAWFFEDAVSPEIYQTCLFPKVSFSTRCKIINRLSRHLKNEEHAEKLFNFIRQDYGSKQAEMLLPKCSSEFISSYIKEHKPLFHYDTSLRILIRIAKRFPKLLIPVLENSCQKDYPFKDYLKTYSKVFIYLANHHSDIFLLIFEKYYSSLLFLRFGEKLTRSLGPKLKEIVMKSGGELQRGVVNEKALFKTLDFDEQVAYLSTVVKSKKSELSLSNWLQAFPNMWVLMKPKKDFEKAKLLETVFKKVYDQSLWDHPKLWKIQLLELLPLDFRERCVGILSKCSAESLSDPELGRDFECDDRDLGEKLTYLLRCDVSIPKLKEIIRKTPTTAKRKIIIQEMVKSCAINKDLESLQNVCDYFATRHRNEDPSLIKYFFFAIDNNFSYRKLNQNIWARIEEIATIYVLNATDFDVYKKIIEKYALYRLENNMDAREQVENITKYVIVSYCRSYPFLFLDNFRRPFTDKLLYLYYDEIFRTIKELPPRYECENLVLSIMQTVNYYNSIYRKNKVQFKDLQAFLNHFDKLIATAKSEDACVAAPFNYYYAGEISKDPYLKERYCTRVLQKAFLPEFLIYILKRKPDYIVASFSDILNDLFTEYNSGFKPFMKAKRQLDFLNLSEEMHKITSGKFKSTDSFVRKLNALKMFAFFAKVDEFEELIREYIPTNERIDYESNASEFVKIQLTVPGLIKYIKPDSKNFELISKFLKGDFLKPLLGSFNSFCHNTPVENVISVLKEKVNAPVSVKKAILRSIAEISPLNEKLDFFNGLWEKEKHYSIRTVILQTISKCFLEEPTDESFKVVKKCILESDELTIEARPDIRTTPARYINDYANALWQFAEKLSDSLPCKNNIRNNLVESFTPQNVWTLSEDFCEGIIRSDLLKNDSKLKLEKFASYYLISNPHSMYERLNRLLGLIRERKENQNSIDAFFNVLGQVSLSNPKQFDEIFEIILKNWTDIFTINELCDQYLTLQYYRAYHQIFKKRNETDVIGISIDFGEEMKRIITNTPNFNELVIVFVSTLKSFLKVLKQSKSKLDRTLMIRQMVTEPSNRTVIITAISLLPENTLNLFDVDDSGDLPNTLDSAKNIGYIIKILKNHKDDVVQIYFNRHFNLKKLRSRLNLLFPKTDYSSYANTSIRTETETESE